jgi:hypothetical protein
VESIAPSADPVASIAPSAGPTSSPPPSAAPSASAGPLFGGLEHGIVLLTAEAGGGRRPLLAWDPVPDATRYAVFVYSPSGAAYWTWWGESTSVHVGGEPRLDDGALGPAVTEGMSWAVLAFDADGSPVAVSPRRPIAP